MKHAFILLGLAVFMMGQEDCASGDDDDSPPFEPPPRVELSIASGNFQSGFINEALLEPLVVSAKHSDGSVAEGVPVRFTLLSDGNEGQGSAELPTEDVYTDSDGLAEGLVTLTESAGMLRVRVETPDGSARPVTFNLSAYPQPTASQVPICFLSFNDFHSHVDEWGLPDDFQGGIARLAWVLQEIRANNDKIGVPTVILDAGDDFENTIYHDVPGFTAWMISTWDAIGVDVWQVGNHDYHFGIGFLTDRVLPAYQSFSDGLKGHPMEITFGNVDPSNFREDLSSYASYFETGFGDSSGDFLYQQTAIVQAGAVKVGVLGVVTDKSVYTQLIGNPEFLEMINAENPQEQGLEFFSPDPEKSDYIALGIDSLVAEGADIIVVDSHAGLGYGDRVNLPPGYDDKMAQYGVGQTSGRAIDLLIGGHSHVQLNRPILEGNPAGGTTPIVHAREGGLFVARVDGLANIAQGGFELIDSRLIQVNDNSGEDPVVAEEAGYWREQVIANYGDWFNWKLAECPTFLSHRAETQSGLGNLLNDAFFWALEQDGSPVETSVVIPSLYRTDLWPVPVTGASAYEVVSLHKMDEEGDNSDTIVYMSLQPGVMDASAMGIPGTYQYDTTAVEYLLEVVHTLPELSALIPEMNDELSVDVVQIAGVSYEVDLTAPMFHHVVEGSVLVNGEPVDPEKTYRMALVETLAATLAPSLNSLFVGSTEEQGEIPLLLEDPETGLLYTDTQIPLWDAFQRYLGILEDGKIAEEDITITGDILRTVQPDLAINPSEMGSIDTVRGQTASFTVRVRNIGLESIRTAQVHLLMDTTPWDTTDQDDGFSSQEGLPEDYIGSLEEIGTAAISIDGYPAYVDLVFDWEVPETLPPGPYTMHVRVDGIVGDRRDPNTGEPYTDWVRDNDSGEQVMNYFFVE